MWFQPDLYHNVFNIQFWIKAKQFSFFDRLPDMGTKWELYWSSSLNLYKYFFLLIAKKSWNVVFDLKKKKNNLMC